MIVFTEKGFHPALYIKQTATEHTYRVKSTHTHTQVSQQSTKVLLRAQLNKPKLNKKDAAEARRLIRLRGWRRGRRRQTDGHRAKVGDEGGDGVAVLRAAKRPPKLQETREFEKSVSSPSKRSALNHKLIADSLEGPGKNPNLKPPNVVSGQRGGLEYGEEVGEVGVAPISTNRLPKAAPHELSIHAGEEDVVRVFGGITERA